MLYVNYNKAFIKNENDFNENIQFKWSKILWKRTI